MGSDNVVIETSRGGARPLLGVCWVVKLIGLAVGELRLGAAKPYWESLVHLRFQQCYICR